MTAHPEFEAFRDRALADAEVRAAYEKAERREAQRRWLSRFMTGRVRRRWVTRR